MNRYASILIFILIWEGISQKSIAQHNTQEYLQPLQDVFQTELVYPQERGEIQLTIAPEFKSLDNKRHILIPFKAEYGITDRWQVELDWNAFQNKFIHSSSSASGIGDLQLGTRYSFMNIGYSGLHAAVGSEVSIPTRDEEQEPGEGYWELEPYLLMAIDLPNLNHAQLFSQAGLSFALQHNPDRKTTGNEREAHEINLGCGIFIPLNCAVLTSELNWHTTKWNGGDENELYFTPGIIIKLKGGWETGLGFPIEINQQLSQFWSIVMITYEFNISKDAD